MAWKPRNYKENLQKLQDLSRDIHARIEDGSFYEQGYFARYREIRTIKKLYNKLLGPLSEGSLQKAVSFASVLMLITGPGCDDASDDYASVSIELMVGKQNSKTTLFQSATRAAPSTITGYTVNVSAKNMPTMSKTFGVTSSIRLRIPPLPNVRFEVQADTVYEGSFLKGVAFQDLAAGKTNTVYIRMQGAGDPVLTAAPVTNPFGLSNFGFAPYPSFGDIDGDGDYDLMISTNPSSNLVLYENESGILNEITNPESLLDTDSYGFRVLADIDSDSDLDVLAFDSPGSNRFFAFINTGSFNFINPPLEIIDQLTASSVLNPIATAGDIDNDGDLDVIAGRTSYIGYEPFLEFIENTGSSTSPSFSPPGIENPFGLSNFPFEYNLSPCFVDFDNDGDLDLFVGYGRESYGHTRLFENTGTINNPSFSISAENPFGFTQVADNHAYPAFADIDEDGDIDLFVGTYSGDILYFENVVIP